ncbi:MAG TPA: hypothetical protein VFJ46_24850, partial [Xanthobacteraceae bacterium]|nr:hypothetical protein [Xanthobacteraceae bacterium]
ASAAARVVAGDLDVAALTMRAAARIAASAITFKIDGDAVRRAILPNWHGGAAVSLDGAMAVEMPRFSRTTHRNVTNERAAWREDAR